MVPSAVVSSAMMTVAAAIAILILINGPITVSAILTDTIYITTSVLAYAVHITEIVAGAVAIFIAGAVGRPAGHLCPSDMMAGVGKDRA